MTDPETLQVYADRAEEYRNLVSNEPNERLDAFIAGLKPGDKVLDIGCGPGRAAGRMADAGLIATAMDPVPEMVAIADQHPHVTARVGGFQDLTETNTYDGVWCNFSLLHAERGDMPKFLKAMSDALRPGGHFHIGMKLGTGAERDGIGRLYTFVTTEELTGLLKDARLHPFEITEGADRGLAGTVDPWVQIEARRDA